MDLALVDAELLARDGVTALARYAAAQSLLDGAIGVGDRRQVVLVSTPRSAAR